MSCPICLDNFTKQAHRKPVTCSYCDTAACVRCVETHITSSHQDPHCFNCRRGWTYEFLEERLPKTWYANDFKSNRQAILMDRERSRLPESQGWAERIKKAREVYGPAASDAYKKKKELLQQFKDLDDEIENIKLTHINKHKKEYTEINSKLYEDYTFYRSIQKLTDEEREEALTKNNEMKNKYKKKRAELNKPMNDKIRPLSKQCKELKQKISDLNQQHGRNLYMKENALNMSDEEYARREEQNRILSELQDTNNGEDMSDPEVREAMVASLMATVKKPGEKRTFTMKCPFPECRGFLNTQYTCGLCERGTCPHCLVLYNEEDKEGRKHECKSEDVETVKEIKKSCRNCPSCGMSIFRIEGCNQMFCTSCNTAFDWATGRELVTNQIHNPHYSEYLRKMGLDRRQAAEQAHVPEPGQLFTDCNRLPPYRHYFMNYFNDSSFIKNISREIMKLCDIYRFIIDIQERYMEMVREELESVRDNRRINAEYLAGVYGDNEWKKKLAHNEASRIAYNEAHDALDAFVAVGRDIFMELAAEIDTVKKSKSSQISDCEKHYRNAHKQFNTLMYIYNKKIIDTIRVYKIPCRVIEDQLSAPTLMYRQNTLIPYRLSVTPYSILKDISLTEEEGLSYIIPDPRPMRQSA